MIFELHGSTLRNYCTKCGKSFDIDYIENNTPIPYCDECDGLVKPDVVLYEEGLDNDTVNGALNAISNADWLNYRRHEPYRISRRKLCKIFQGKIFGTY